MAFCLLACACGLVAVAGPRASAQLRSHALRQLAVAAPALDTAVVGTVDANTLATALNEPVDLAQLEQAKADLRRHLAETLPLAGARTDWSGLTTPFSQFTDHSRAVGTDSTQLELAYRDNLSKNVRIVAGSLPSGSAVRLRGVVTVPVAISAAAASRFDLGVGSHVQLASAGIVLAVTGIVAPIDTGGTFWGVDPIVAAPVLVTPVLGEPYWQGGAFVAAGALPALNRLFDPPEIQLTWVFGTALGDLTAAQAVSLAHVLPSTLPAAGQLVFSGFQNAADVNLTSGVSALLGEFAAQNRAVSKLLDLMSVSLGRGRRRGCAAGGVADGGEATRGVRGPPSQGRVTAAACYRCAGRQRDRRSAGSSRRDRGGGAPDAWRRLTARVVAGRPDARRRAGGARADHDPRAPRICGQR